MALSEGESLSGYRQLGVHILDSRTHAHRVIYCWAIYMRADLGSRPAETELR
jgi:hypothetical protein